MKISKFLGIQPTVTDPYDILVKRPLSPDDGLS